MAEGYGSNDEHYDAIIAGKEGYLNFPFFFIRAVAYILGWWYAAKRLIALSKEDTEGGLSSYKKSIAYLLFSLRSLDIRLMMAWDWIMSIDTHWFSTLFVGLYLFNGRNGFYNDCHACYIPRKKDI